MRHVVALGCFALAVAGCGREALEASNRGELRLSIGDEAPVERLDWDFGEVPLRESRVVEVQATNVGPDALTLTRLTLEGADTGAFFALGATGVVAPGAAVTAKVTFAPVHAGAQSARLVFEHDAQTAAPVAALMGQGL